jgi:hypothetical protein
MSAVWSENFLTLRLPIQGSNFSSRTRDIGVTAIPNRTLGERCFGKETQSVATSGSFWPNFDFPIRGLFG